MSTQSTAVLLLGERGREVQRRRRLRDAALLVRERDHLGAARGLVGGASRTDSSASCSRVCGRERRRVSPITCPHFDWWSCSPARNHCAGKFPAEQDSPEFAAVFRLAGRAQSRPSRRVAGRTAARERSARRQPPRASGSSRTHSSASESRRAPPRAAPRPARPPRRRRVDPLEPFQDRPLLLHRFHASGEDARKCDIGAGLAQEGSRLARPNVSNATRRPSARDARAATRPARPRAGGRRRA